MKMSIRSSFVGAVAAVLVCVSPAFSAEACGSNTDKNAACSEEKTAQTTAADTADSRARLELSNAGSGSNMNEGRRHGQGLMARERIEQNTTGSGQLNEPRASLDIANAEVTGANTDSGRRHGQSLMARERIEREILNSSK